MAKTKTTVDLETGEITPVIRKPYERVRTRTPIRGASMTHQSHAETCDINNIIRRFDNTGVLPPARYEAQYADVTPLQGDLTEAYNQSLETIDTANQFAVQRTKEKNSKKQKQLDIEKEIESIKKRLPPEPDTSGSSPPPRPKVT